MSRARPQNQPPSTPLSPHQRQQPTPTRCRTQNPRHRHRRPQKRTLTIKKRTIKCRPFLVALFATPFHFFHPAPSPIIPLLHIYLIIPIYLSHWVSAFTKHFFPEIENLKAQGKEFVCAQIIDTLPETKYWVRNPDLGKRGFWLPLSGVRGNRFFPDFICELQDGQILVLEYKG